jgi:NitT/TauT family transport system permease protein
VLAAVGFVAFGVLWELVGRLETLGRAVPPLTEILSTWFENRTALLNGVRATATQAAAGWFVGTALAVLSGILTVFVAPVRRGVLHLAVIVSSVPVIALGPVLISIFPREVAPMALAAIAVYFTTLVATTTGFASTRSAHDDLLTVLGTDRSNRFWRLQLPTGLPLIVDALKLAVPAAVLGAILGEWFGSPRGLGPILVATMQDAVYGLLWAAALTGVVLSLIGFGIFALVHSWVRNRFG